jgi:hypothetical protein
LNKLWNYNHFKFINDNIIKEYSEFNQYQMDVGTQNPLGPGYGFAIDPSLSIYGSDSSPYVDYYSRLGGSILRLNQISKSSLNDIESNIHHNDEFINDIDKFSNFKILRIFKNNSLYIDVFISYEFDNNEYFGVFKNFNKDNNNIYFKTELYTDSNYQYINQEYKLKLKRYIKNKLDLWFNPKNGLYLNLKNNCPVKNIMGETVLLKINSIINVINTDFEKDGNPYIIIKHKNNEYYLKNNDYFYFNYWFKSV